MEIKEIQKEIKTLHFELEKIIKKFEEKVGYAVYVSQIDLTHCNSFDKKETITAVIDLKIQLNEQ